MPAVRTLPTTQLRLPPELKAWLQHQAIDARRSMNAEVVLRLEQSRAQQTSAQAPAAQQAE